MYFTAFLLLTVQVFRVTAFEASQCGVSKYADAGDMFLPVPTIVGGIQAREYEFPWQVSLRDKASNSHFCGGTIISDTWILTAAHCLTDVLARSLSVVVGEYQRSATYSAVRQTLDAQATYIHKQYAADNQTNDIGLIKLAGNIVFNVNVQPACLPVSNDLYQGQKCQCSGWGTLFYYATSLPDYLQYVTLNITTDTYCHEAFLPNESIYPGMMCATDNQGDTTRDSCQGDSGGPLTVKNSTGNFHVVGIVSWGIGCASGFPGVYTRVSDYLQWIDDVTNGYAKVVRTTLFHLLTPTFVTLHFTVLLYCQL
jgi:secreted trypsin-like serine protease